MARVAQAGIRLFAVTDHDTVAALDAVAAAAARLGLGWVPGIEVTAVERGVDVHVLGYGFDPESARLTTFLRDQRQARLSRLHEFGRRFDDLGLPFDVAPLVARATARAGRSVGRGHVARALVAAGHVTTLDEAFARWLSPGCPGFVPRQGAGVAEVVATIAAAGGIVSLAHPGLIRDDDLVAEVLRSAGLTALEAFHSEHDAAATRHYAAWAARAGLAVSGGSDHHGEGAQRKRRLGGVTLPPADFEGLWRAARRAGCARPFPALPAGSREP